MKRFRPPRSPESPAKPGFWTRRGVIVAGAGLGLVGVSEAQAPAMSLWPTSGPPVLRGAVIVQRRRRVEVDGESFGGGQAVLPVYGAAEFDALTRAGANLVVMSFPELWTVERPWRADPVMAITLMKQIELARAAGLYVIVALRSGPGRSDFVFHREAQGSWFPAKLIVDSLWTDAEAQAAWGEMCVDAAKRIAAMDGIAGLNIMVEPDPNVSGTNRQGGRLGAWTPAEYEAQVSRISDWKRLSGEIARKVRAAAPGLPILISPPSFARTDFLRVMGQPQVTGTVWCVHDYEPREYTHTTGNERGLLHYDEHDKTFETRLDAAKKQGAPVFLGEFGASQAAFSRHAYHRDRIAACEARGVGWAVFRWPTGDKAYEAGDPMFDVTNPDVREREASTPRTIDALRDAWGKNTARPGAASLRGRGDLRGRSG
jgi:hypothetical protein